MTTENKVRVYAPIQVQEEVEKIAQEKASALALPDEKQGDLRYIRSVLVSAGTNKNGAHFLPSEMMKAHSTIVNKAIDIEHDEERVIGHIYDCAFVYKDGEQFDPGQVLGEYAEAGQDPEGLDIDIVIAVVIHKMRFPEIAEEISDGVWKVSMECFFRDFDIKIGMAELNLPDPSTQAEEDELSPAEEMNLDLADEFEDIDDEMFGL